MDIACPNCAATYRVPDLLLAGGKALRCAACDHEWAPEAPPLAMPPPEQAAPPEVVLAEPVFMEPPPPDAPPPPEPEPPRAARMTPPTTPPPLQRRPAPRPVEMRAPATRHRARALPIAWLASVTLVLMALLALVIFGDEIALAWPPFARVSALLSG